MSEQEKSLLMALDEKFTQELSETEQSYVMGVTHGLLLARETAHKNDKKGEADDECA